MYLSIDLFFFISSEDVTASVYALALKGNALGGSSACATNLPLPTDLSALLKDSNYRLVDSISGGKLIIDAPGSASSDTEEVLSTFFVYDIMEARGLTFTKSDTFTLSFSIPVGMSYQRFQYLLSTCYVYGQNSEDSANPIELLSPLSYSHDSTTVSVTYPVPPSFDNAAPVEAFLLRIGLPLFTSFCRYLDGNARWEYTGTDILSEIYPDLPASPLTGVNDF